ncbi:hypothetical protein RMATCC62417_18157 [Rhizopus microsporus]|nr:hypothetical protein RMATCC62417_18157 [Rhizopus microsporus]
MNNNNSNHNNIDFNENSRHQLFPPLESAELKPELLWDNINTLSIPGSEEANVINNSPSLSKLIYEKQTLDDLTSATSASTSSAQANNRQDNNVFNISWGGNDKPPVELHPEKEPVEEFKLSRPLPKPRGIRKLPEPEPSEDGKVDEDILKRRKNTDAARRSRLKKLLKVDQLETRVATLQAENAKLILNNAVLESEKKSLYAKEAEYKKRIKYLEDIMKRNGWNEN